MPPSDTVVFVTIPLIVNDMETSCTEEIAVAVSPSVKVPTKETGSISNITIESPPSAVVDALAITAVAPELTPVKILPITSEATELTPGEHLRIV